MKWFTVLIWLSLTVILVGFMYDIYFAGIPYQDPTPELQSRWNFHKDVSNTLMLAGVTSLTLVALVAITVVIRGRMGPRRGGL